MQAPVYPPAAAYQPPAVASYELNVRNASVAELMANPAAWAIVVKHMPAARMMTSVPLVKHELGNMTLLDFAVFSNQSNDATFAAIDAELKHIPAAPRGAQ